MDSKQLEQVGESIMRVGKHRATERSNVDLKFKIKSILFNIKPYGSNNKPQWSNSPYVYFVCILVVENSSQVAISTTKFCPTRIQTPKLIAGIM